MAKVGGTYRCSGCTERGVYPDDLDERFDRYGIYAGLWHDSCWERSSIRNWTFDPLDAGERLEPDD